MTQAYVKPLMIPLIKVMYNGKSGQFFVNMKFLRDTTSSMSYLYEFMMPLFDNGDPKRFLLFVCNPNMNLAASRTLDKVTKIQYLCTLVRGEALLQFDSFSDYVESTKTLNVKYIVKVLSK